MTGLLPRQRTDVKKRSEMDKERKRRETTLKKVRYFERENLLKRVNQKIMLIPNQRGITQEAKHGK